MSVESNVYETTANRAYKAKYTSLQTSMVSIGMLVAALGLLAIFGIGLLIRYAILIDNVLDPSLYDSLYLTSGIFGVVALVMYFIWIIKVNMSLGFNIAVISVYCLSVGITFGIIFTIFELTEVIFCFGITSLVLFLCYGLSRITSNKVGYTIGKILAIFFTIYFIFLIVNLFLTIFSFGQLNLFFGGSLFAGEWTYFVIQLIFGLASFLIIWYSLWNLKNMDQFRENLDPKLARSIAMLIGFNILINMVALLRLFLYLLSRNR